MKNVQKFPYFVCIKVFFGRTMQNVDTVPRQTNQTLYYSTDDEVLMMLVIYNVPLDTFLYVLASAKRTANHFQILLHIKNPNFYQNTSMWNVIGIGITLSFRLGCRYMVVTQQKLIFSTNLTKKESMAPK